MKPTSAQLIGYQGANPFRESQAREYPGGKVLQEFFPTSVYKSLFNEQNEILIGTRGSGKTILLRMLSYTHLRAMKNDPSLKDIVADRQYLGFYVPLHLELIRRINRNPDKSIQYFIFSLNCSAAEALLGEIRALLEDLVTDGYQRREIESSILKSLTEYWSIPFEAVPGSIEDLQWALNLYYAQTPQWEDQPESAIPLMARTVLMPIRAVLPRITHLLGLDSNNTRWMACIDEAEFLPEPYIKALNTFMRSEKKPLTIKIATLPFEHSTAQTLEPGIKIEPNGNDFNYRKIDYDPDSDDFHKLTDHITRVRLARCGVESERLEDFFGVIGNDEGFDYYSAEIGAENASAESLLLKIRESLSPARHARFDKNRGDPTVMSQQYIKKFSPVLYVREMKKADSEGNRAVGWFAGAKVVRRVADGNCRRFVQLMNEFFQLATEKLLLPRNQHRVIVRFSNRNRSAVSGLPRYGLLAKEIVDVVGAMLSSRTHEGPLREAGCDFRVDAALLANDEMLNALKTAIAYSHVILPDNVIEDINNETRLRLSYLHAVCFWLPMRKGDPVPVLRVAQVTGAPPQPPSAPTIEETELTRLKSLQMTFDIMDDYDAD